MGRMGEPDDIAWICVYLADTFEAYRKLMSINADGMYLGTQYGFRAMKEHGGGSIINMSSILGLVGDTMTASYNASKGAVRLFSKITGRRANVGEATAAELGGDDVIRFQQHDSADEQGWKDLIAYTEEAFGPLNVLVNNAGIGATNDIEQSESKGSC
ncbi:SDR family NAD(P)-dependent oxidoreductase [Weissella confusa]|uniref:SDR family NAD(P)-dependent oxidoreductase n=1 Tax=Weissella confusa TaxID=1583 RepID=A0A923NGP8_WEICO|nr:SDR family NAD(P)-dependent oxidoreductase [Weissella confusa]